MHTVRYYNSVKIWPMQGTYEGFWGFIVINGGKVQKIFTRRKTIL